jgi:hypothetical protein
MSESVVFHRKKGCGKTTECIRLSAKTRAYIVCPCKSDVLRIWNQARKMKLNIPYPYTFFEWKESSFFGNKVEGFIFDDIDRMLSMQSNGIPVVGMSLLDNQEDLDGSGVD